MNDHVGPFIHSLRFEDLPNAVIEQAQYCLLDLLGVAAAGGSTQLARIACDHAAEFFGAGSMRTRLLFDGRIASPLGAALAGAMTIDSFDGHDGHSLTKGHVGVAALPALLAMAELDPSMDGRAFLTSLVLGYEIGTRAGIALHATSSEYHTSGAWNALAAAAVIARGLKLDIERTRHALGIAEYHGPRSDMMRCIDFPTMLKDGSGWGCMAGVSAAFLAERHFSGAPALTIEAHDEEGLWSDLGQRWIILEQYFKPFPVCRWAHPAITCALRLRETEVFVADAIESVEIETFHEATRLCASVPVTTEEAQYGVLFPVAAALLDGRVDAETIGPDGLADARLHYLIPRLRLQDSAAFSALFPAQRWARVIVHTRDGRTLDSGPMQSQGDPERPLPRDALRAKFRAFANAQMDPERAAAVEREVFNLTEPAHALSPLLDLVLSAPETSPAEAIRSVL